MFEDDIPVSIMHNKNPREGWAEQAQSIAEEGNDELLLGDFDNQEDQKWSW